VYVSCRPGSQSERALCMFVVGQAASERAMRGSTNILILNDEDRESLRTACRVSYWKYFQSQFHSGYEWVL